MIDKETCSILFEKYNRTVYNTCYKYLKNISAAEDCTQEVFYILLKKKSKINLTDNLLSWLIETAKIVCKKYIRKNSKVFLDIDNYSETIADNNSAAEKSLYDEIYEILDKDEADLLFLYINSDHGKRKEIAKRMGIKTTALYQRVKRIRERVMLYLESK